MKGSIQEMDKLTDELQQMKLINEVNKNTILSLKKQLTLLESTKAWKIMCLLRRINEQFFKGNKNEKKKFVTWFLNKLLKKTISSEYSLARFSPIQNELISLCEMKEISLPNKDFSSFVELQGDYINYNVAKSYDLFRFPVINWNFRWQRPQQISCQFADNGHRVFYLSVDIIPLGKENLRYNDIAENVLFHEVRSNVWEVKVCSKNPINVYSDSIVDETDLLYLNWSIDYIKERFDIGYTISIVDLPFWKPMVVDLNNNTIIYDCMDEHTGFSTNSNLMLSDEIALINISDLVIVSSQRLYEKNKLDTKDLLLLRNAGEYQHFSVTDRNTNVLDFGREKKIIGYYGAISEWFDIDLICFLAKRHSDWEIILIGDTFGCDITKTKNLGNVKFLGEKPYTELPEYLNEMQVAIIPFLKNELTMATNPVKVYEYLSAGKPVVSTDLPELQLISEYLYLAATHEQFEASIIKALESENNEKEIQRRKSFASKNTWKDRYETLSQDIKTRFFPKVSVVIVTYNNWAYTKQCLDSLFHTNDYPNIEIIVVDNMSTDETRIELSRIIHPNLKVILSPNNTGFAGGNSIGCQFSTGEYIVLLNNDTILTPGWIHRLIKPLKENDNIGMAGPVSNSVGNDQMLDFFVGDPIEGPDKSWLMEFYEMYKDQFYETDLLGFYCVAIKREVYERVGDLDVSYGIGMFEDDDYCERVRALGYKLVIVKDAFVYHHGSASFKKIESSTYHKVWETNKALFEKKWGKEWVQPKKPKSVFVDCQNRQDVSNVLKSLNKEKTIILGHNNWNSKHSPNDWENFVVKVADEGQLVIVKVHTYNFTPIIGIRKLSDNIYLTNQIDLFSDSQFDSVIYCGETVYHNLNSENYFIYSSSYDDQFLYKELVKKYGLREINEQSRLLLLSK